MAPTSTSAMLRAPTDGGGGPATETTALLQTERHYRENISESSRSSSSSSASSVGGGVVSSGAYGTRTLRPVSRHCDDDSHIGGDTAVSSPVDEERASLATGPVSDRASVVHIVLILLIAVFVANADASIVLSSHPAISSEFNAMEDSSWLFTAFNLASCATQALFGKVSDIYGRKPVLLVAYIIFALGCCLVGVAQSMFQVILGRIISGSVGGGMNVLVSILLTDLVPIKEVPTWRAYVNIAATTGRATGGPLGGWLVDVVGWRWSFLGQAPFLIIAAVLCQIRIPSSLGVKDVGEAKGRIGAGSTPAGVSSVEPDQLLPLSKTSNTVTSTSRSRLSRVDFLGATTMALFLLSILVPLEIGGVKISWTHPLIPALFGTGIILAGVFVLVETRFAREPILPMELFLNRQAVYCFLIMACQTGAQVGMIFAVPLYFQVSTNMSSTEAGAHLVPAVVGNATGAIVSAALVKRYGRYKWLTVAASIIAASSYILMFARWHGNTNWLETLYLFPGGFGTGIVLMVVFVAMQAVVEESYLAPAISTLYLCTGIGAIVGLACVSAVQQSVLRLDLESRLLQLGLDPVQRAEIISKAVSNVDYIYQVGGKVSEAVVASYVKGLEYSHVVSLAFSFVAFLLALPLRERKL